jgi:hypothetical protein
MERAVDFGAIRATSIGKASTAALVRLIRMLSGGKPNRNQRTVHDYVADRPAMFHPAFAKIHVVQSYGLTVEFKEPLRGNTPWAVVRSPAPDLIEIADTVD